MEVSSKVFGRQGGVNTLPLPRQDSLRRNLVMEMMQKKLSVFQIILDFYFRLPTQNWVTLDIQVLDKL